MGSYVCSVGVRHREIDKMEQEHSTSLPPHYKSGFVNIVGNPNVGKSTIMNALVGEKLSIITSKAQTTRHRILGIVNTPDMQIVYSDTPGVLRPNYKLQERMRAFSDQALTDADVLVYVTDVIEKADKNADFVSKIANIDCPVLVVINKIDLTQQDLLEHLVEEWHHRLPKAEIIPASALHGFSMQALKKRIEDLIPECHPYFEQDALTDRPARFFVTEIIREKILLYYQQEIPYAVEILVEEFKEQDERIDIRAIVMVERESQKGIIIGHKGAAIKKLGTTARRDLEHFFEKHINLELIVRVDRDWRHNEKALDRFGYEV